MSHSAFKRVLRHFEGNQSKCAAALGTSQQRISYIVARKNPLPAELVLAAEKATGIPRHVLRPDIYPAPAEQSAAA